MNFVFFLLNLDYIREEIQGLLSDLLFKKMRVTLWKKNLLALEEDPLLIFMQSTSLEIILKIRKNIIYDLQPDLQKSKKKEIDSSSSESESEPEDSPDQEEGFRIEDLDSADQRINSPHFLNLLERLQYTSNFENSVTSDNAFQRFQEGELSLPGIQHWLFLKAKCDFYQTEMVATMNLLEVEMRRRSHFLRRKAEIRRGSKEKEGGGLQKRDHSRVFGNES